VRYGSRDVLSDPQVREGVKKFTQWPTIPQVAHVGRLLRRHLAETVEPQVFVDGEFVGGSDILMEMHNKGELQALFEGSTKPQ
jgi:monothiol glutaredoxin